MLFTVSHRRALTANPMLSSESSALLATARKLQEAASAGKKQALLRGKNFGLLCETDDASGAMLFSRAATELGAHVAHIRPSLTELSTPQDVAHTARLLGRLYDAVECEGVSASLVQQMGNEAGVPIFEGVASASHPTAELVDQLEGDASVADKRRFILQAVLLSTLS